MANLDYPPPLQELLRQLRRLPGVGPRSAERMALWLLAGGERLAGLTAALSTAGQTLRTCERCGFFSMGDLCGVCADGTRDPILCVVERSTDMLPIERSGAFRGYYHALGGRLSPLEHVGPEDLRLAELEQRLGSGRFEEVILALSTDVEGEATANYLEERLAGRGVRLSRLAQGMPAGGGLDATDELTLARALSGRQRAG